MVHTASKLYTIWKILFNSSKKNSEEEFNDLLVWPSILRLIWG